MTTYSQQYDDVQSAVWRCTISSMTTYSQQYDDIPHTQENKEILRIQFFMLFIPCIFLYSIFSESTKMH